ncbi:MAG: glycosyltransferase [Methylomicrobium sp.]|nr:glycosyltransferase [Methylomicrobium sp.]
MKVLHVYRCYYPDQFGGLQEAIRQIALTTQPFGVESRIFTLSPNPSPELIDSKEAQIIRSRSWLCPMSCDIGGPDAYAKFRQLAEWADIIHYQFPWPFADLMHVALKPKKPTLITYQSDIVGKGLAASLCKPLTMQMLKSMNCIVATSPQYRDSSPILSQPNLSSKVRVIPLAISESGYDKSPDFSGFETETFDVDKPFVLFIGAFRRYKGLKNLLAAAKWVKGQIVLIGTGLLKAETMAEAQQLGAKNLIFLGSQSHASKVACLVKAKAVVLPSNLRSEAFGMVLVEGLMFGKPLISCDIDTGVSYVNAHNETGFVVPPNDPGKLANAINRLLDDEELNSRMGKAARIRYETYFSGDKMGEAYYETYRQLLMQKQPFS